MLLDELFYLSPSFSGLFYEVFLVVFFAVGQFGDCFGCFKHLKFAVTEIMDCFGDVVSCFVVDFVF